MSGELVLSELVNDAAHGPVWLDWCCEPPPPGSTYRVLAEEDGGWRRGTPVRRIVQVEVMPGNGGR